MISCTRWLKHLEKHLPVAHDGKDTEGVHQLRVAAGRLATWLELTGARALRDDLRWLRSRASAVRDLDVQLGHHPPAPLVGWLRRRRTEARRELLVTLESPRVPALLEALKHAAPIPVAVARAGRETIRQVVLARGDLLLENPTEVERLHALRRALRRLRYADDWLGLDSSSWKDLQDAFGTLNDLAVAQRLVSEYPGPVDLSAHAADLASRFEEARQRALAAWGAARPVLEQPPHAMRPPARSTRRRRARAAAPVRRRQAPHSPRRR